MLRSALAQQSLAETDDVKALVGSLHLLEVACHLLGGLVSGLRGAEM